MYVRKFRDCETIYIWASEDGASSTEPHAYPYYMSRFRAVDMFTSILTVDKKEHVSLQWGNLHPVVATTYFGIISTVEPH